MDILLTDSLLREYLDTKATPQKLAECLSLCGPSIEKITTEGKEKVYHIEVTTNRVDAASALGVAREASAILPQFGITAKLKQNKIQMSASKKDVGVSIKIEDKTLCERFTAIKLSDVEVLDSPLFIKDRLTAMGQRPLNNIIDITNYAMMAQGIPMHAFDYDALGSTIEVRVAKKGEQFVTLDEKIHKAFGGEVVFDNGKGEIVDLPGIMGTKNTMVTKSTKNVLLVLEHINHHKVRFASIKHETRTNAAVLNEKNPDPNEIAPALSYAVDLLKKYAKARVDSKIFDWYPKQRKTHEIVVTKNEIDVMLGLTLTQKNITNILESLEFKTKWSSDSLTVTVPTSRVQDVTIPEDIIEEIARIYGYFRLPSVIPEGLIPTETRNKQFDFEMKIKRLLSGWGGNEVYTLSLVSKSKAGENAIRLKNPLGGDGEYLRTVLTPSLIVAAEANRHESLPFHLFEVSNVYLSPKGTGKVALLPNEETRLAGIFVHTDFRHAKGILEALFEILHITNVEPHLIKRGNTYTYEYSISDLMSEYTEHKQYVPIPTFPPQIEDLTLLAGNSKVGAVMSCIKKAHENVTNVEFLGSYEDTYSFRITYQNTQKTLTDSDVSEIRKEILHLLKQELKVTLAK